MEINAVKHIKPLTTTTVFVNRCVNPMQEIGMNLANQYFVETDYLMIILYVNTPIDQKEYTNAYKEEKMGGGRIRKQPADFA